MSARFPPLRRLLVADDNQHGSLFGNILLCHENKSLRFLKISNNPNSGWIRLHVNFKMVVFCSFAGVFQKWLIALDVPDLHKLARLQLARTYWTHVVSVHNRKLN